MSLWSEREEDLEAQLSRSSMWAITYGDLMSFLMIFFLMNFAAAAMKSTASQMKLVGDISQRYGVQQIAKLELKENKMRIVFSDPVLFDPGQAEIKESSLVHLKRLSDALKEIPNTVQIEGHTDDRPLGRRSPFKSNWELSAARAFSLLRFLEGAGIPARRLSAIGYGEFRPVRPNDTAENRGINRRIEVNIIRLDE